MIDGITYIEKLKSYDNQLFRNCSEATYYRESISCCLEEFDYNIRITFEI